MKTAIVFIVALVIGFGLAYIILPQSGAESPAVGSESIQQYTCGMHPEIISDEPGYCPICEMKLTPKKNGSGEGGSVVIDPTTRRNMGLVTTPAENRPLTKRVHAFGRIAAREPSLHEITLKFDGWIEKLFVDHEGEKVAKGQPLLEVYSPALVAAQEEFLIAYKAGASTDDLMQASLQRLANWDISADQIEKLKATGEILRTMLIRSPADGIAIAKAVFEGDRLKAGTRLYRISDLSTVWAVAHVYEQDLPFVALNQAATVTIPGLANTVMNSKVSYVSPYLDNGGQVEIRLDLDNSDYRLKPEMFAEVGLEWGAGENSLVVPRSAVINSGLREVIYIAVGEDEFKPRIITTGAVGDDDLVEVLSGLKEKEMVVVSGQFLLDSESRLVEALADGAQIGHDHGDTDHDAKEMREGTNAHADVHTCPMPSHFNVLQYGEGKCSECGMDLVPVEETNNTEVYVCPMRQCGTVTDHEGRCDVCGMKLVKYQPEGDHDH